MRNRPRFRSSYSQYCFNPQLKLYLSIVSRDCIENNITFSLSLSIFHENKTPNSKIQNRHSIFFLLFVLYISTLSHTLSHTFFSFFNHPLPLIFPVLLCLIVPMSPFLNLSLVGTVLLFCFQLTRNSINFTSINIEAEKSIN